jgi:tripartite-type tricarboxylate transporter receptor subunit TctC
MKKRHFLSFSLIAFGLVAASVQAQSYPEKPLRLVVPYPPGASTDILGRMVAQKLSESMGRQVIVDNRGGASGNIGTEFVAKSAPDGYTFQLGTDATHGTNMSLVAAPPFHPVKDFTPLSLAAFNPIVLVVHPSLPANNLRELIAYVKANPSKSAYGSSGNGSPHHLAGEMLRQRTGVEFTHVSYRGGAPALNDLLGGQISMVFSSLITALPHIHAGKLRAIALTQSTRYDALPELPTMAETLEGFDMPSWLAFLAPANLPAPIAKRLSDELIKALREPDVSARLNASGLSVVASTPAQLAAQIRKDFEARGKIIREVGIKGE